MHIKKKKSRVESGSGSSDGSNPSGLDDDSSDEDSPGSDHDTAVATSKTKATVSGDETVSR